MQDTLERAWTKLHLWRGGSDLRAWLFTIMHNVHVNQVRSRGAAATLPLDDDMPDAPVRATQADMLEVRDIDAALRRLPLEQREVLLLVALEHMSYQQAADTLGIPIGTVMSRLSRARERLRIMLEGRCGASRAEGREMSRHDDHRRPICTRGSTASCRRRAAPRSKRMSRRIRRTPRGWQAYRRNDAGARRRASMRCSTKRAGALRAGAAPAAAASRCAYAAAVGWIRPGRRRRAGTCTGCKAASTAPETPSWARRAAVAHVVYSPEVRHPVEVAADQEAHLVAWLSKRLGTPLKIPRLDALGFGAGRRAAAAGRPGAGGAVHVPGRAGPAAHALRAHQPGAEPGNGVPLRAGRQRAAVLLDRPRAGLRAVRRDREGRPAARGERGLPAAQSLTDGALRRGRWRLRGLESGTAED